MARFLGIRNLCFDAQRSAVSRALESVLIRPLWLLLCMFKMGEVWRNKADPEERNIQLQEQEKLRGNAALLA
jgi:hypothetical protein